MDREKILKKHFDKVDARFAEIGLDISNPFEVSDCFTSPEYIGKLLCRLNWFYCVPVFVPLSEILVFASALLEEWGEPAETQLGALIAGAAAGFIGPPPNTFSQEYDDAAASFIVQICSANKVDPQVVVAASIKHAMQFATLQALDDVLSTNDSGWDLFDESPTPLTFQVFSHKVSAMRYQYKFEELLAKVRDQ